MQRASRKREAILAAVCATKEHPSAEWVYERLKPRFPDLSLGTVYRNLSAFKDEGKLTMVDVVGGESRFDGDVSEHPHFICDGCGSVIDLPQRYNGDGCDGVEGYIVRSRKILYRGICPACQMSANPTDSDKISETQNI